MRKINSEYRVIIHRFEIVNVGTGEVGVAKYDTDWQCWSVFPSGEDRLGISAEAHEASGYAARTILTDMFGEEWEVLNDLPSEVDVRIDDNIAEALCLGYNVIIFQSLSGLYTRELRHIDGEWFESVYRTGFPQCEQSKPRCSGKWTFKEMR